MKAVADTGALIWLERIGYSQLPHEVYSTVWAPPDVERELGANWKKTAKIWPDVKVVMPKGEDLKRFDRLVRRWSRKQEHTDKADVEVLVLYREFVDADEMLYANKNAEEKFGKWGKVRDIYQLCDPAIQKKIWTTNDAKKYLNELLKWDYRTPKVREELKKY